MSIADLFHSNPFFSGAVGGGIALGLLNYLRPLPGKVWNFAVDRFSTVVAVHSGDSNAFWPVNVWLARQKTDTGHGYFFYSVTEAAKHGFTQANVSQCLLGRRAKCKGYHWEYA